MKPILQTATSSLLILLFVLSGAPAAYACGPFAYDPIFGFTRHGEYPLSEYAGGRIGLVPNSYGRISLFVFYRYLNDAPLNGEERRQVARAIRQRITLGKPEEADSKTNENDPLPAVYFNVFKVDIWKRIRKHLLQYGASILVANLTQLFD